MADEEDSPTQPFFPFPPYLVRSKEAALREILEPCGQFRSPLTLVEKMGLFFTRELLRYDMLANVTSVIAPGTPLNWQVILKYLHEHGVIAEPRFFYTPRRNDAPKIYGLELHAKPTRDQTDGKLIDEYGYATSHSSDIAMSKAIGEILERFLLTCYRQNWFIRASYAKLSGRGLRALDINHLNAFLPWQQKKSQRFKRDDHSPFYWIRGETIEGASAYIPAQLVFWNYDFSHDISEPILSHITTNGAAGHFTKEEAILSGLLETIERDGFLIYWLNSLSPRVIDAEKTEDDELREFLSSVRKYGLEMYFLDTTTDVGIPSVTCALVDARGEAPFVVISAASGFTIQDTILKSGQEALNILQLSARRKEFTMPEDKYEPFTDASIGQTERIALWKGEKMMERFSFFLSGEHESLDDFLRRTPQNLSPSERLQYVIKKLNELGEGYEVYLYEVKHEVLKTLGYHVVQTIVPQLIPMYLSESLATLDSKRLREVPSKLGFKAAKELKPWPHPFP